MSRSVSLTKLNRYYFSFNIFLSYIYKFFLENFFLYFIYYIERINVNLSITIVYYYIFSVLSYTTRISQISLF